MYWAQGVPQVAEQQGGASAPTEDQLLGDYCECIFELHEILCMGLGLVTR